MKNIIILSALFLLSSCSILLSNESPELVTEKSCKQTCMVTNRIYVSYDKDFGCMCQSYTQEK
jgi:hypothetical protein